VSRSGAAGSGAALFAAGAALVGLTFLLTGQASPSGPALLAWVILCVGGLRLLAGLAVRPRQAPAPSVAPAALEEPAALEPPPAPEAPVPAEPVTPLEWDFGLLGLEPGALFRDVKRAYWASRIAWSNLPPHEAAWRLSEGYAAYKRLRRIYQDSGAR
jgi:hypothetical protein